MQRFYQGSMRCKDFLPFLVNALESHGWNVADSSGDGQWAVVQKATVANGIMTFIIKEQNFPNFGALNIRGSITKTNAVDENGVYIGAYDPTTKTAQWVITETYYQLATAVSVVTYGGNWNYYPTAQYYNSPKADSDDTPVHLFYILSIDEEGFYLKTRGNPAVANNAQAVFYGGVFEKLWNEIDTNNPKGLWGQWGWTQSAGSICYMSMNPNGTFVSEEGDARKTTWQPYSTATHFTISHPHDADNNPKISFDGGFPVSKIYITNAASPVIAIPLPIVPRGTNLVSENYFLGFNGDKYVYITEGVGNTEAALVKVMSGVKNLQVTNTGSGHELSWINPNSDVLDKVKLYAKMSGMPTGHDDPDAILIHTIDNAIANDIVTFVDSASERHGQTVYYAAFAFDSGIPTPNVSIVSPQCSAKISPVIAALPSHVTVLNPANVAYEFSNSNKINAFYSPVLSCPCNDNADSKTVTELINGLHGTATSNTSTMSITGKNGLALNLSGNKAITFPVSPLCNFPYSYTLQGWFKKPATWGANSTLFAHVNEDSYWRWDSNQNMVVRAKGRETVFPYKYNWVDEDFIFWSLVKKGHQAEIFLNGSRLAIGNVHLLNGWSNLTNSYLMIGTSNGGWPFNGAVENIEAYAYPLSPLQIKYSYNEGSARIFDPAFYNYSKIEGMSIISDIGALNEKATVKLQNSNDFSGNLSGANSISVDCYSLRAGNNFSLILTNSAGVEFVLPVTVSSAKTWENVVLDISAIQDNMKRDIKKIGIKITNADEVNIISIKNVTR